MLLPLTCAALLVYAQRNQGLPRALMRTLVLLGVIVAVSTEVASIGHHLTAGTLALVWAGCGLLAAAAAAASGRPGSLRSGFRLGLGDVLLLAALVALLGTELAVGLIGQPNTWDSMTYHLARVGHWIQRDSVAFYVTSNDRQLWSAPLAEYAITHLQLLTGSTRSANLVQWLASVGVAAASYRLAALTGIDKHGRLLAAAIAITAPMAVLQATSTQNDLLTALWVLIAWEAFFSDLRTPAWSHRTVALTAASLALLTKSTSVLFLLAVTLLWLVASVRREPRVTGQAVLLGVAVALALNGPFQYRVWQTFERPLSPVAVSNTLVSSNHLTSLVANSLRNTMTQATTQGQSFDATVAARDVLDDLGLGADDPETVAYPPFVLDGRVDEDYAPSPAHAALILVVLLSVLRLNRTMPKVAVQQVACALLSLLLFAAYLRWQPWINRLLLPGMLVWAAPAAYLLRRHSHRLIGAGVTLILVAGAATTLLFNVTRPLYLRGASIVKASTTDVMFVKRPDLQDPYVQAVAILDAEGARTIGLVQGGNDWEYPLRVLSGGVESDLRLLDAVPGDERRLPGVQPDRVVRFDAIFCTDLEGCGPADFSGWRVRELGPVRLFLPG